MCDSKTHKGGRNKVMHLPWSRWHCWPWSWPNSWEYSFPGICWWNMLCLKWRNSSLCNSFSSPLHQCTYKSLPATHIENRILMRNKRSSLSTIPVKLWSFPISYKHKVKSTHLVTFHLQMLVLGSNCFSLLKLCLWRNFHYFFCLDLNFLLLCCGVWQPPGSVDGQIKFTEQGEVITYRYGNAQTAAYELTVCDWFTGTNVVWTFSVQSFLV